MIEHSPQILASEEKSHHHTGEVTTTKVPSQELAFSKRLLSDR